MHLKNMTMVAVLLGLLVPARAGYCWDKIGHMVVAQIAYDTLKASKQDAGTVAALDDLAQAFNHDALAHNAAKPYPAYNAITIAAWMDDLKDWDGEYNAWHYIDLQCGAALADVLAAPAPNAYAALAGKGIDAGGNALAELGNKKLPAATRARALAYLMHIEGDLHQPFHAVADKRGGTQFPIMLDPMSNDFIPTNLHFLWDCAYRYDWDVTHAQIVQYDPSIHSENGFARPVKAGDGIVEQLSQEIMKANPPDADAANLDPAAWALESNTLACNHVPPSTLVTPSYIHTAHDIAWERLAVAGYRLAGVLRNCGL